MVKRVSQDVIATIKADPLIQAGNEARIREVIEVEARCPTSTSRG